MPSFLTASVLRDLSFRTRLGRRPHTINTDSLASLHSTQLARLTLTTFFLPRSIKRISDEGVSSWIDDDYRRSWAANTNTPSRHSNQNYHYSPYRNSAVHKKKLVWGEPPLWRPRVTPLGRTRFPRPRPPTCLTVAERGRRPYPGGVCLRTITRAPRPCYPRH